MNEPLPCPFCGQKPVKKSTSGDDRDGYADKVFYVCEGCGCSQGASGISGKGGYADNSTVAKRALDKWNMRVESK